MRRFAVQPHPHTPGIGLASCETVPGDTPSAAVLSLIPEPTHASDGAARYSMHPRPKRSFQTVLDAENLLDTSGNSHSSVRWARSNGELQLQLDHPVARGRVCEELVCAVTEQGLRARKLVREVFDHDSVRVRHEEVHFTRTPLELPDMTYPEVTLPFLLGWFPFDGARRSVYAWINDRMVARVYVEHVGKSHVSANGSGKVAADELLMYPDLNDWVKLPAVLTKLAKPFVPKYRMWFEREAPHRLLRFEGPYGPPGAPEVVLELLD